MRALDITRIVFSLLAIVAQILWSDTVAAAPFNKKLPTAVASQYDAVLDWSLSPDATYYVVYAKAGDSYRVEVRDRKGVLKSVVRDYDRPLRELKGLAVTSDGQHATYWLSNNAAYVWNLSNSKAAFVKAEELGGEVFNAEVFNFGIRFKIWIPKGEDKIPVQRDLNFKPHQ